MGYSVEEVLQFVEENDVKFIRLAFCDLFGTQKNISIMPGELKRAFEYGKAFDGTAIKGFEDSAHTDLFLKPDPSTLSILPWRPQQGRVIRFYCDIFNPDGTPFIFDSRNALRRAIKRCSDMGYGIRMSEEAEFYLFLLDENGNRTQKTLDNGTYLDVAPSDKGENIRREICLCLEEMGILPESSHHENGPGQNEIVFKPSDALSTADNLLTFKNVVANIANRNGLFASFMPKPIKDKSGNGLHINMSLYKNGINLFDSDEKMVEHFMAGIMKRIREITLFLNPISNSYERFGEFEAPQYITWSKENRCQLLRVPEEKGDRRRVELRSPDSCMNPYLAFALILQAGLDGMEQKMPLPEAVNYDLHENIGTDLIGKEQLPSDYNSAVKLAKSSCFIKQAIGEKLADKFIETKESNHGECVTDM